jgi:Raf kinase inhibitor-like YbhB/YbcL family protein
LAAAGVALTGWVACSQPPPATQPAPSSQATTGAATMKLTVRSTAFDAGQRIPKKHTGEGEDVSPALAWSDVPAGTVELALIMDDPDAPTPAPWVHWVLYKLPAKTTGLTEGVAKTDKPADLPGALQGKNSFNRVGHNGPMPPPGHGTHHYHFKLYALDQALTLGPGATKAKLVEAMRGHILAEGELIGTYSR